MHRCLRIFTLKFPDGEDGAGPGIKLKTDVADASLSQPHFFIDRGGGAFIGGWLRGVDG